MLHFSYARKNARHDYIRLDKGSNVGGGALNI